MQILQHYLVHDLFIDIRQVEVTLLLESPYSSEVVHKHPLAGDSGKNVTNFFMEKIPVGDSGERENPNIPFGCFLKKVAYPKIGVMNCLNYPMDKGVYSCKDIEENSANIRIEGWDFLRRNSDSTKRRNPYHKDLENSLLVDLQSRIAKLPKESLIIPCGEVARNFLRKVDMSIFLPYPDLVPHPSRNQWSGKGKKMVLDKMHAVIMKKLGREHYNELIKCFLD